jgi:hypothetical protein
VRDEVNHSATIMSNERPIRGCAQALHAGDAVVVYEVSSRGRLGAMNLGAGPGILRGHGTVTEVLNSLEYLVTLSTGELIGAPRCALTLATEVALPVGTPQPKRRRTDDSSNIGGSSSSTAAGDGSNSSAGNGGGSIAPPVTVRLPLLTATIHLSSKEARQELNAALLEQPYTAALGSCIARLWSPDTDTLAKFAAVIAEIIDSGVLSNAKAKRAALMKPAFAQYQFVAAAGTGNGVPLININYTINSHAVRQELTPVLWQAAYTAALGNCMAKLWIPETNTLQKLLIVLQEVIDAGVLNEQQVARLQFQCELLKSTVQEL